VVRSASAKITKETGRTRGQLKNRAEAKPSGGRHQDWRNGQNGGRRKRSGEKIDPVSQDGAVIKTRTIQQGRSGRTGRSKSIETPQDWKGKTVNRTAEGRRKRRRPRWMVER